MSFPIPSTIRTIHMIGICGTGMGAFAQMLKARGYAVQGSDAAAYPPMSDVLRGKGITVMSGYDPAHLDPAPDLVIVGNVATMRNPEFLAVARSTIPFVSMADGMYRLFMKDRHRIALCGTHGKTTTTALCAHLLDQAGMDPGFFIGGVPGNFDCTARSGRDGAPFVVEGDEYDTALFDKRPKMLVYRPTSAVVGSVEFDHADIYPDLESILVQFRLLAGQLPADGHLLLCAHRPELVELEDAATRAPVRWFGIEGETVVDRPLFMAARDVTSDDRGQSFTLVREGVALGRACLPMWGRYNLHNALAALLVAALSNADMDRVLAALATFTGIRRRQEIRAEVDGVTVIDDFAHHPTAVDLTLTGLTQRFPGRPLVAVFDPRTNTSRRSFFQQEFARSFGKASRVYIAPPEDMQKIPEDQRLDPEALVGEIRRQGVEAVLGTSVEDIVARLADTLKPGDVVAGLSNGGFKGFYDKLLTALRQRGEARS